MLVSKLLGLKMRPDLTKANSGSIYKEISGVVITTLAGFLTSLSVSDHKNFPDRNNSVVSCSGESSERGRIGENNQRNVPLTRPPPLSQEDRDRIVTLEKQNVYTNATYAAGPTHYRAFWRERGVLNAVITEEGVVQFLESVKNEGHPNIVKYVKGLQDEYRRVAAINGVEEANIRSSLVRKIMKEAKADTANRTTRILDDRQEDAKEVYTPEQYEKISRWWLDAACGRNTLNHRALVPYTGIQIRSQFLQMNACLEHGDDVRKAELDDVFNFSIPSVGPDKGRVLAIVLNVGNTNQNGCKEFVGCMRNTNPFICPIGALAQQWVARWDINKRTQLPNLQTRKSWYQNKVTEGRIKDKRTGFFQYLCYETHLKYTDESLRATGVLSRKKTHLGCGGGARMLLVKGAKENSIQRLGRLSNEPILLPLLTEVPVDALLRACGSSGDTSKYFLPRSRITPPEELLQMIWPFVDKEYQRLLERNSNGTPDERDISAQAFLETLIWLREVFLQDHVFIQDNYSTLPVFQHPVFRSPLWLQFKTEVQLKCRAGEDLQKEIRDEEEKNVSSKLVEIVSNLTRVDNQVQALRKEVNEKMSDLERTIKHLLNQGIQSETTASLMTSTPENIMEEVGSDSEESNRNLTQTRCEGNRKEPTVNKVNTNSLGANDNTTVDKMSWLSLNLKTIKDVWQAYHEGIGPIPPIKNLEKNKKKHNWRKGKCGQFYDWSVIWKEITERSEREDRSPASILNELMQKQENNSWSLRAISRYIQSKRPNSKSSKAAKALNNGE